MSTTPVNPIVEMLIDGSWIDITPDVRQSNADSGGGLEISRGVPNEGNFAEPTQFNFTLNNGVSRAANTEGQSAVYSPTNLQGPYFGLLGRNQRLRVGLDRRIDSFSRTVSTDTWGSLPDQAHADGTTVIPGERWYYYNDESLFDISSNTGTIGPSSSFKMGLVSKTYRDVDVLTKVRVSDRTTEFGIILRSSDFRVSTPSGLSLTTATGWGSSQGTVATDSSIFRGTNTSSVRLTTVGVNATASLAAAVGTTTMHVLPNGPNGSHYLRAWLRCSASTQARVAISWYKEDGSTFISSTNGVTISLTANVWQVAELSGTPPQDAKYARIMGTLTNNPPNGTQLWIQDPELHDTSAVRYYQASILPGGTDQYRLVKKIGSNAWVTTLNLSSNVVAGTWYWMRAQVSGQRIRMKLWADGSDEPTGWNLRWYDRDLEEQGAVPQTGAVGLMASGGSATVTFDSVQIDQWRAHTETSKLPVRFDLSRRDHWVPVQSRGILRRLNQGRKALKSAVSLHLEEYTDDSHGWWPLESDDGDSALNNIQGSNPALITGVEFGEPDSTGQAALPGVSGIATLSTDVALFNGVTKSHTSSGAQTFLWFMRLPNLPASETTVARIGSTGTARTWQVSVRSTGGLRVIAYDRAGTELDNQNVAAWGGNADLPVGCWLACTLYVFQSGGSVVWALNHHRPGSDTFWTLNGTFGASVGIFTGITFRSNSVLTAAGNLQVTQVMHYNGDLPFVDYDFRMAAQAYDGELAAARFLRLGSNAGIPVTTTGDSDDSVPMGIQSPSKLVELMEESAEADGGLVMEERDDFGLTFVTGASVRYRVPLELDIDAGHLTAPLEGDFDDQQVRNDVTISRPGGSARRFIKTSGPLNTNSPETDPDGVGTYDEQKTINVGTDDLCGSHAAWRVSRGTQDAPRYPSFRALIHSDAYQSDSALAAETLSVDVGDVISLTNTEADYAPRRQFVQSYSETIPDLYEHNMTWTAQPDEPRRVGIVNYTTRIGSESMYVAADFDAGTDTTMQVTSDDGMRFVTLEKKDIHFPMEIEAGGVRLTVTLVGQALNSNPGFESGTTGWTNTSANVSSAADLYDPVQGSYCMRTHTAAAGTDGIVQASTHSTTTTPGADYLVSGWIKTEVGATAARLTVDWYQSNNTTFISTSAPATITTVANEWTWYSAVVTAPALGARARVKATNVHAGSSRAWYDNLRLVAVSSYTSTPQTLTVEQTPVNANFGASGKTIVAGTPIRIVDAMHVGWGAE